MNLMLEGLKESGFKDSRLLDRYLGVMAAKYPDEEIKGKTGVYPVPKLDGALTTVGSAYPEYKYINGAYTKVKDAPKLTWVPNRMFFDVMKVDRVGDCRLHMKSESTGARFQTNEKCADAIVGKLVNGYISGLWVFKKHGNQFYVIWKGEPDES